MCELALPICGTLWICAREPLSVSSRSPFVEHFGIV